MLCVVLFLAACASMIVGVTKSLASYSLVPNALWNVGYSFGVQMGIWDLYPNNDTIPDNLLSPVGIMSLIAFAGGAAGIVFSRYRLAELKEISGSLRKERMQNKFRRQLAF